MSQLKMKLSDACSNNGLTVRELAKRTERSERTLRHWWATGDKEKVFKLIKLAKGIQS